MAQIDNNIRHLVFSGGGVKVISYAGALKALEEKHVMDNIKKVAGTSGGAISALCISLGYTAKELEDILLRLDFTQFAEHKNIWSKIYDVIFNHGLNSGHYLESFLTKLITDKGFDQDITFKQLHDSSVIGIDLYVVCTNLNRQFPEVSSYETTPDKSVLQAVRASGAFPLYFQPIKHNGEVQIDGGIFYNYPVEVFDDNRHDSMQYYYLPMSKNAKNISTLGFTTINNDVLEAYQTGEEPKPFMDTDTIIDIVNATVTAFYNADSYRAFMNNERTVFINDMGVSTLNFNITTNQKKDLINSAHDATINFLSQYSSTDENLETSLIADVIMADAA